MTIDLSDGQFDIEQLRLAERMPDHSLRLLLCTDQPGKYQEVVLRGSEAQRVYVIISEQSETVLDIPGSQYEQVVASATSPQGPPQKPSTNEVSP